MDALEKEIMSFIARERQLPGLGKRSGAEYPATRDFYLYLTDNLSDAGLEKMLDHLKKYPEDQQVIITARGLLARLDEAQREKVPDVLLEKVLSRIPEKGAVSCPYCQKSITPFKKPLGRQRFFNFLWLGAGILLFAFSFLMKHFFIQWTMLGALCVIKWIVDQKSTKTQIMIYKALSEEDNSKTRHLHRADSHL